MKKVIFCMIIFIFLCTFSGCAEIVYKSFVTPAGGRVMEWSAVIDKSYTTENDPFDSVVEFLQTEKNNRVQQGRNVELIVKEENRSVALRESYASLRDMYIAYGYTGYEKNEPNKTKPTSLLFEEAESQVRFVDNELVQDVYNHFDQIFLLGIPMNFEGASLQFHYGTPYKTVNGKNADSSYKEDGLTFYVWDVDLTNVKNADIILVQQIPRVWVFELIAVAGAIFSIIVVIIVNVISKRSKNVKNRG